MRAVGLRCDLVDYMMMNGFAFLRALYRAD